MPVIPSSQILNDRGVIMTVGLTIQTDRTELVWPMFTDNVDLDLTTLCQDACNSMAAGGGMVTFLTGMMGTDCYVSFFQAIGMVDGRVPSRIDFASTEYVGTVSSTSYTANTSALFTGYAYPPDIPAGKTRMRSCKVNMPGVPKTFVTGNRLNSTGTGVYNPFLGAVIVGFPSVENTSYNWYRAVSAPKPRTPGTPCVRIAEFDIRGYLSSLSKRLRPH